jgi:hypothetical protein
MRTGVPERLRRLPGERAARGVGDRPGNHEGQAEAQLLEELVDGEERGLRVQRVEDGLDEEQVHAAFDQGARRDLVGDRGPGRRLTARKPGSFTSGESESVRFIGPRTPATNRALPGVSRGEAVGDLARDPRRGEVHFRDDVLEPVIGLRDRGRVEGVGLEDVRARLEVLRMNLADDLRAREAQRSLLPRRSLGWSLKRSPRYWASGEPVALDHRAHGAVEHEDALLQRVVERGDAGGACRERLIHCS